MKLKEEDLEDDDPNWVTWIFVAVFMAFLLALLGFYWIQLMNS